MAGDPEEKIWLARQGPTYRKLVDGGMIYDADNQQVHHLNSTAAHVWEVCQQGRSCGEIVRELQRLYEVETGKARADVEGIIARFAAARLIEP